MPRLVTNTRTQATVLARVLVNETTGCWVWQGRQFSNGYGRILIAGKYIQAHRLSYEVFVGPIPHGLTLDHLCRNRACVNPRHLESVTGRENTLRGEGVAARNADKTHCIRGHLLSGDNLITLRRTESLSRRQCRECGREAQRRYDTRQRSRTSSP